MVPGFVGSKNKTQQNVCLKTIKQRAQNISTIRESLVHTIGGRKVFAQRINKHALSITKAESRTVQFFNPIFADASSDTLADAPKGPFRIPYLMK